MCVFQTGNRYGNENGKFNLLNPINVGYALLVLQYIFDLTAPEFIFWVYARVYVNV